MNNLGKGAKGEYLAEKYLKSLGYKIVSKNCKFANSEIDIVAIFTVKAQKKAIKQSYKKNEIKSKTALKCMLSALDDILVFIEVRLGGKNG